MPKLIAERLHPGQWRCRPGDRSDVFESAALPHDAMRALCLRLGLPLAVYVPTEHSTERIVFQAVRPNRRAACPDCGGTGRYIGLVVIEPCAACKGTGAV